MSDTTPHAAMAERAARAGGAVAGRTFREPMAVETKEGPVDVVTAADRESQARVISTIREEFPDGTFVCEEESRPSGTDLAIEKTLPETGSAWVIDPIDGTANYVRGMRFWTTSVAAVRDGDPLGVATYLPASDDSYTAGRTARRNGEEIAVSDRADPELFAVAITGRLSAGDLPAELFGAATRAFGSTRRLGTMQGALALVAAGGLDGAIAPITHPPWDTVAGVHLVRRAGGTVTDVHGDRWHPGATGLVASSGRAHDRLVKVTPA